MQNVLTRFFFAAFLLLSVATSQAETIRVSRGGFSFERPTGAQGVVTQTMSTGVITGSSEPYNLMIPASEGSSIEVYAVSVPGPEDMEMEVVSQRVVGHLPTLEEFGKEIEAEFQTQAKSTTLAKLPALKFSGKFEISIFGEDPTQIHVFGYAVVKRDRLYVITVSRDAAALSAVQTEAIQQLLASFTILD